jgi:hypothetical protein
VNVLSAGISETSIGIGVESIGSSSFPQTFFAQALSQGELSTSDRAGRQSARKDTDTASNELQRAHAVSKKLTIEADWSARSMLYG